jgi:hypothetical protein
MASCGGYGVLLRKGVKMRQGPKITGAAVFSCSVRGPGMTRGSVVLGSLLSVALSSADRSIIARDARHVKTHLSRDHAG